MFWVTPRNPSRQTMPKVASKTRKKRVEKKTSVAVTSSTEKPSSKRRTKRSKKDENAEVENWQNKKRKIERKIKNTEAKVKKTKRSAKKPGDYRNILEYKSDKDMRNVEKRLRWVLNFAHKTNQPIRERLKKKRQEEVDEEEELLKSTSESSQSSSDSNSNSGLKPTDFPKCNFSNFRVIVGKFKLVQFEKRKRWK